MTLSVLHPGMLWLLAAVPLVWVMARRTLADFTKHSMVLANPLLPFLR